MFTLPPGFATISEAYAEENRNKSLDIIAVVVDCLPPAKTKIDWSVKLTLNDHSGFPGLGAPFHFFHANQQRLPPFGTKCDSGDIIIIRHMSVKDWGGVKGLSNHGTQWIVISGSSLTASATDQLGELKTITSTGTSGGVDQPPRIAELLYAKELLDMIDPSAIRPPAARTSLETTNATTVAGGSASRPTKFSLIKDVLPSHGHGKIFKDIFVEVRRIYKTDSRMCIYVTDYTPHELLYDYKFGRSDEGPDGDQFNYLQGTSKVWPGPHGKKTMLVTLWDAHARFAFRELDEGNFVLLKNVHMTLDKNGSTLEGHCRGDRNNMEKLNITIVKIGEAASNEELRELLKRKRATEKAEGPKFIANPTNVRRRAEAAASAAEEVTMNEKTARNKKRREKRRKGNMNGANAPGVDESDGTRPQSETTTPLFTTNTEVRILKIDIPCKPISQILDREILARKTPKGNSYYLPFQNCRYKSQVRVVDFLPHDVADFAAPYRKSDYDMLRSSDDDSSSESEVDLATQRHDADVHWEWRFCLVVEDASPSPSTAAGAAARMELLVVGDQGEYLLKMDACDLRRKPLELQALKEKLFVLWGDLQELKEEAAAASGKETGKEKGKEEQGWKPRARPFECLIAEYGVPARDARGQKVIGAGGVEEYERVFHLHGTTVK